MFTTETRALMALGYSLVSINTRSVIFPPNLGVDGMAYVDTLLARLVILDTELETNIRDSMAVKIQDIGVNYAGYIAQARAQGSRLLKELAAATSTPVTFDRYSGSSGNSITIRNYY